MTTLRQVKDNATYYFQNDISIIACARCQVSFGITADYMARRREDGQDFYCPSGHQNVYRETDLDRARKRAKKAEDAAAQARQSEQFHRDRAAQERRSSAAYKGHLTRAKNRVANGVCPVPGCKRSGFVRVAAHISSQHPTWAHDHPEVMA